MPPYDALILGGGPAGATAALILARAGWRVAIAEKNTFPRRKVCGEFISATSLPLLFELGVGEEYLSLAGPEVRRVGLFAGEVCLSAAMPAFRGSCGTWGRALGREHLDLLLLEAAARAGAEVWQPWKALSLERRGEKWTCTLAGARGSAEISAPVAVCAYGSWEGGPLPGSATRRHRDSDLLAFKAHFRDCDLAADLMPLLTFPGGYGGMVTSDSGRATLSCCIRRDQLVACREQSYPRAAEAVLAHIRNSCAGVRQVLQHAHLDDVVLSAGPIRPGIRRCYTQGIFFTGNIAGEAHPIVAEGISMAMQSSWLLCRRMIAETGGAFAAGTLAKIGRTYTTEWRNAFVLRIEAAALFAQLAMRPSVTAALRPLIGCFPHILTIGARFAGKAKALPALPSSQLPACARH